MGEGPGRMLLPHGWALGPPCQHQRLQAPGSWRQEGTEPPSRLRTCEQEARRALDKGVFILDTNKATVAGDSVSSWPWPAHLCILQEAATYNKSFPGYVDVMNTSAPGCVRSARACFSHSLPQEGSPVSKRPAPT